MVVVSHLFSLQKNFTDKFAIDLFQEKMYNKRKRFVSKSAESLGHKAIWSAK